MDTTPEIQQPSFEEFIAILRSALHYLYDPVHLRRSQLVEYLGQSDTADSAAALQRILTESISSLKPSDDEPPQSTAWTIYDILNLHYARQYERSVVASQLGISERQLRREQRLALEALAQYLWKKFNLDAAVEAFSDETSSETAGDLSTELNWLRNNPTEEQGTLLDTLQSVQTLAKPLAEQCNVSLHMQIDPMLEETPVPQASFRSILLTILNAVVPRAENGTVEIQVFRTGPDIHIQISSAHIHTASDASMEGINLDTAQQLAAFYGADLEIIDSDASFRVTLRSSTPEQVPILVIDDNADWLEMLKRYAVGTRYQVITTRDSRSAAALAEKIQPAVIFLDVMMPNVDGWQVLSELRQVQDTHQIPLVVCTVLPLEDLALSLGVNVFLQKPITQEQFLHTIQEQISKSE